MATRNPANVIEFGKFNYGATMTPWTKEYFDQSNVVTHQVLL